MMFSNNSTVAGMATSSVFLYPLPTTITIGIITSMIAAATTTFNFITLLAFALKKSLRNFGDHFILNLAVADMAIGVMSIPPYIPYILTGRWSAGRGYCLFWLLWDYITPAASTFNMCAISLDRYLLVAFPIWYRQHQGTRLLLLMMLTPWIIVTLVYGPSILLWELISGEQTIAEGECKVPYAHNLPFLLFGSAVEFIFPFIIMSTVNLLIFLNIRRRSRKKIGAKIEPVNRVHVPESSRSATRVYPLQHNPKNNMSVGEVDSNSQHTSPEKHGGSGPGPKDQNSHGGPNIRTNEISRDVNAGNGYHRNTNIYSIPEGDSAQNGTDPKDGSNHKSWEGNGAATGPFNLLVHAATGTANSAGGCTHKEVNPSTIGEDVGSVTGRNMATRDPAATDTDFKDVVSNAVRREADTYRRDRKAARSLFILVFVFTLCWLPYEILALISAVCPTCINSVTFEVSFWLLWVNSTINPILYPLLHKRFRDAFFSIMRSANCCKCKSQN